jgi:hypothetical protein
MTVGLPGAGIGGLFYLLSGLLMPVREACLTIAGRSSRTRWRTVLHQFSLSAGIASGTAVSGWLLAAVLAHFSAPGGPASLSARGAAVLHRSADWLRPTHGLVQLATLVAIVGGTWLLGTLLAPETTAPSAEAELASRARTAMPTPRSAHDLRIPTPAPWRARSPHTDRG